MIIEVDVEESDNCPLSLMKAFESTENPTRISQVETVCPDGIERLCFVAGWSSKGPDVAYAVLVDDSGEGLVTLVYGGAEGIRLQEIGLGEPWSLSSANQWGEPYLLLSKDVSVR